MAIEEANKKELVEKKPTSLSKPSFEVRPKYGAWTEGKDRLILEVVLPGVDKKNISVKALKDHISLKANRDEIQYILELDLNIDIVPEETKVNYDEGLLHIEFKRFNPLDKAYIVPINGKKPDIPKEEKDLENVSWILPDVDQDFNPESNTIEIELALPGIKAETIIIKALPEWFNLTARRDKYEYRANAGFLDEVVPEKITAEYQNGLLKIHAPLKDKMDQAMNIKID